MERAFRIHDRDNVAVALVDLAAGDSILGVTLVDPVPKAHKISLDSLKPGQPVFKYGHPIGFATTNIAAGAHVHSRNLATGLSSGNSFAYDPQPILKGKSVDDTFLGYRRDNGTVGTRNEIWVLNTVGCVNSTAARLARDFECPPHVDGIHAFGHPFGCSQLGDDLDTTRSLLAALAQHPNAGGVLIVGLGCENNQLDRLLEGVDDIDPNRLRAFNAQSVADEEEAGLEALAAIAKAMEGDIRTECPASALSIGVKCGGSDAFSGLTANPLVGLMTDQVTAAGGRSILTEIPEIFGAEQLLMNRAVDQKVFGEIVQLVDSFKAYFERHNQPVYENPSPGNKAGGITTLEEKSLGAVQKGGSASLTEVIRYGDRATQSGLVLLEAPGNDAVSSTALAAAGATVILFTTGRGTPLGFPAPTVKISSNTELAERKEKWIDFDTGPLLVGEDRTAMADRLWRHILAVASGQETQNERNDSREIAIWKGGVTV